MIVTTKVTLWTRRAEQARRIADTLSARDRDLLRDYARECEFQARRIDCMAHAA
jgi:hypothetical protein